MMKGFVVALLAIIAVSEAASCTLKPLKRECGWSVTFASEDENATSKASVWRKTTYFVNGLFWAKKSVDYADNLYEFSINRPDIAYDGYGHPTLFKSDRGMCSMEEGLSLDSDPFFSLVFNYLESENKFYSCNSKDVTFNGEKKKDWTEYKTDPIGSTIVYAEEDEVVAIKSEFLRPFFGTNKVTLDWSNSAGMGKFSYSRRNVYKCPDERIYDSGNDTYAFCAASTVKAALTVVLAAVATALIALF